MLKRFSFGQYKYKGSVIHNLDPRLKFLYLLVLSILIFMIGNMNKMLLFTFFILVVAFLAKIDLEYLIKNLRPFIYLFVFIFVMYLFFSRDEMVQGIITIWRFFMLILMSFILTFTTPISSMVAAIEKLLKPLRFLGIKPRNIAILISMTIRFIPVMFINMERLSDAMVARLASLKNMRNIKLLILKLIEKMFKSASTLSDALQSRLYNENVESNKILKLGIYDYLSLLAVLISIAIIY